MNQIVAMRWILGAKTHGGQVVSFMRNNFWACLKLPKTLMGEVLGVSTRNLERTTVFFFKD